MKAALIEQLTSFLAQHELFRGQPATEAQIAGAEQQLGVRFDADYRQFIGLFGGSYVGVPVYGFNNCQMLSDETVTDLTNSFRNSYGPDERWPGLAHGYVISMMGNGDPVIINAQGRVVVFHHDYDEEEVLAPSFEDLLEQNIPA